MYPNFDDLLTRTVSTQINGSTRLRTVFEIRQRAELALNQAIPLDDIQRTLNTLEDAGDICLNYHGRYYRR